MLCLLRPTFFIQASQRIWLSFLHELRMRFSSNPCAIELPLFLFMPPREYIMSGIPWSLHCTIQCSPFPRTGAAGQKRGAASCFPSSRKGAFASRQQQDFLAGGRCQGASEACGITAGSTTCYQAEVNTESWLTCASQGTAVKTLCYMWPTKTSSFRMKTQQIATAAHHPWI